ncbi:MAG: TolC family protein [Halobacteriovoraceae bacterium]|nr:TolC family protein [Halobacteriovoraceae bacterium]
MKILFIFSSLIFSSICLPQLDKSFTLKEILKLSENLDEISEMKFEAQKSQLDSEIIKGNYNPKFEVVAGIGPITEAYGNAISSQNSKITDVKNWNAVFQFSIGANYPIYTWGQKNDYLEAARLNELIGTEKVNAALNEIKYKIKETYSAHLLTNNLIDLASETLSEIDEILAKVSNKDVTYRLNILKYQLESKKTELLNHLKLSESAFKYFTNDESQETKITLKDKWLEYNKRELNELKHYLQILESSRPELKQIDYGISAKNLLSNAVKKSNLPQFGAYIKYQYSYTSAREPQDSVYAYDPYNENRAVGGIGVKWNFDLGITNGQSAKHKVESIQLKSKKIDAFKKLSLLVKKNWIQIKTLEQNIKDTSKAMKFAKKLLQRTLAAGTFGLSNSKSIVDSYEERILTYKDYVQKIHEYNMAWANLSLSVGQEVDPLLLE